MIELARFEIYESTTKLTGGDRIDVAFKRRISLILLRHSRCFHTSFSRLSGGIRCRAPQSADLFPYFNCTVADGLHNLLQLGWRNIEFLAQALTCMPSRISIFDRVG